MAQTEKDFMIYEGLLNDITKEEKRARLMLNVGQAQNDDDLKKIFIDRINRKRQMYTFYT